MAHFFDDDGDFAPGPGGFFDSSWSEEEDHGDDDEDDQCDPDDWDDTGMAPGAGFGGCDDYSGDLDREDPAEEQEETEEAEDSMMAADESLALQTAAIALKNDEQEGPSAKKKKTPITVKCTCSLGVEFLGATVETLRGYSDDKRQEVADAATLLGDSRIAELIMEKDLEKKVGLCLVHNHMTEHMKWAAGLKPEDLPQKHPDVNNFPPEKAKDPMKWSKLGADGRRPILCSEAQYRKFLKDAEIDPSKLSATEAASLNYENFLAATWYLEHTNATWSDVRNFMNAESKRVDKPEWVKKDSETWTDRCNKFWTEFAKRSKILKFEERFSCDHKRLTELLGSGLPDVTALLDSVPIKMNKEEAKGYWYNAKYGTCVFMILVITDLNGMPVAMFAPKQKQYDGQMVVEMFRIDNMTHLEWERFLGDGHFNVNEHIFFPYPKVGTSGKGDEDEEVYDLEQQQLAFMLRSMKKCGFKREAKRLEKDMKLDKDQRSWNKHIAFHRAKVEHFFGRMHQQFKSMRGCGLKVHQIVPATTFMVHWTKWLHFGMRPPKPQYTKKFNENVCRCDLSTTKPDRMVGRLVGDLARGVHPSAVTSGSTRQNPTDFTTVVVEAPLVNPSRHEKTKRKNAVAAARLAQLYSKSATSVQDTTVQSTLTTAILQQEAPVTNAAVVVTDSVPDVPAASVGEPDDGQQLFDLVLLGHSDKECISILKAKSKVEQKKSSSKPKEKQPKPANTDDGKKEETERGKPKPQPVKAHEFVYPENLFECGYQEQDAGSLVPPAASRVATSKFSPKKTHREIPSAESTPRLFSGGVIEPTSTVGSAPAGAGGAAAVHPKPGLGPSLTASGIQRVANANTSSNSWKKTTAKERKRLKEDPDFLLRNAPDATDVMGFINRLEERQRRLSSNILQKGRGMGGEPNTCALRVLSNIGQILKGYQPPDIHWAKGKRGIELKVSHLKSLDLVKGWFSQFTPVALSQKPYLESSDENSEAGALDPEGDAKPPPAQVPVVPASGLDKKRPPFKPPQQVTVVLGQPAPKKVYQPPSFIDDEEPDRPSPIIEERQDDPLIFQGNKQAGQLLQGFMKGEMTAHLLTRMSSNQQNKDNLEKEKGSEKKKKIKKKKSKR